MSNSDPAEGPPPRPLPVPDDWRRCALDPPRAAGAPLAEGVLRAQPDDFQVEEVLGFAPSGCGAHVLLKVRKRDANTQWVARELARRCGCRPGDVGFAGLKDRHAVATQWFSVPRSKLGTEDWRRAQAPDFEVLEAHAHARKLPRGALAGNRFVIRVRGVLPADAGQAAVLAQSVAARCEHLRRQGVPNYFGAQRFGRDGGNLATLQHLSRLPQQPLPLHQPERGFVLSAARSLVFNAVLAERVREGSWNGLEAGDLANLDGRGSFFAVSALDAVLQERAERLEIHPTGPMWGQGAPATQSRILELERRVAADLPAAADLCVAAGMAQERRSLRLRVADLECRFEGADVSLSFQLTRGSFATVVLRELFTTRSAVDLPDSEG